MQKINKIILFILAAISTLLTQCQGCSEETDEYILKAVPSDAGVIIETSKLPYLIHYVNNDNKTFAEIKNYKIFSEFFKTLKQCDTALAKYNGLHVALENKKTAVSFHKFGKDKTRTLLTINVNQQESSAILNEIHKILKGKYKLSQRKYEKTIIFSVKEQVKDKQTSDLFYYAYAKNLFVISNCEMLIETAVRQIQSRIKITDNQILSQLLNKKGKNVDANVIINYKNLYELIKNETAPLVAGKVSKIAKLTDWTVFDFTANKNDIVLTGFTKNKDVADRYLNIFENQNPVDNNFTDFLPANTIYFASIGISNVNEFKSNFHNYLRDKDKYSAYSTATNDIRKAYGVDQDDVYDLFSKRITEFTTDYFLAGHGKDNYLIVETLNEENSDRLLDKIVTKYKKQNNLKDKDIATKIISPTKKTYLIKKFPIKNFFSVFYGDFFATVDYQYYLKYKNNIIFGQNISSLSEYIKTIDNAKNLSENNLFKQYADHASSTSNVYYYFDVSYSQSIITTYLNKTNADDVSKQKLRNLRSFCLQYSRFKDMYLSKSVIKYSDEVDADHRAIWLAAIDSTLQTKPFVTTNHINNEKEIALQSTTNKFYLLDKNGNILIKKQIPEPIVGNIYQIDYYANNKLQYLFATENHLYLIDRNANIMDGYPVRLPARVSSSISVFDYDNSGNYRIFVPCADNKLYLYTKEGTKLPDWTPIETAQNIITPVQYLKVEDKDYIVFADNLKTYILNRRGETRINTTGNFPKAKNTAYYLENSPQGRTRFVTTNSSGQVEYIYMDGSRETKTFKNYTANHYFLLKDINNDGINEYIFADKNKLEAFKYNGDQIFSRQFDSQITEDIMLFSFSQKDIRLGITCGDNQKIYLINNQGNICKGFPLNGTTKFSIAPFNKKYSILTGGNDNFIYNYQMP